MKRPRLLRISFLLRAARRPDGEPLPETLWYRVEVEISTGWVELVKARASTLGVSEESARDEAKWTALQNGLGISGINGSPSA